MFHKIYTSRLVTSLNLCGSDNTNRCSILTPANTTGVSLSPSAYNASPRTSPNSYG